MPKAIEFVEKWIDANVSHDANGGSSVVALDLADKCRDAAATQGFALSDLELRYGSLEKIIYEALHHAVGKPSN